MHVHLHAETRQKRELSFLTGKFGNGFGLLGMAIEMLRTRQGDFKMYSYPVCIWANFSDTAAAGEALTRLRKLGYESSQIAVHQQFRRALNGFDWGRLFYLRIPEGLVTGFAGGAVLAIVMAFATADGWVPSLLHFSVFTVGGVLAGSILGVTSGLVYAVIEQVLPVSSAEDVEAVAEPCIEVGVQCFTLGSGDQAKAVLAESGAAAIDIKESF